MYDIENIVANGGATINKKGIAVHLTGYQVSFQDLEIFPVNELTDEKISSVIAKLRRGDYCGLWIDNGLVYLDISRRVKTKKEALTLGKELNQLTVLRWRDMECLAVR